MCKRRVIFYALTAILASPILWGVNCPQTGGGGGVQPPQTLLQNNLALTGPCSIITPCPGVGPGTAQNFSPTQVGKSITATVTASLSNSRPIIEVQDLNGAVSIASSGINPTTNTAEVTFTSTSTGVLILAVCECSANLSPSYDIMVTQAP